MQTLNCEKCILLFTDALQGELPPSSKDFFDAHISECEQCFCLYEDFKKLSDIIENTPAAHIPSDFRFNTSKIAKKGKQVKKLKTKKRWLSVAAVFLFFLSSYIVSENKNVNLKEDYGTMRIEQDSLSFYDNSSAVEECQQRSGRGELYPEVFEEALLEDAFAEEIDRADAGFGYELLEYKQEEDGSVIFVIYFYQDETRTLKTSEESLDFLSLENVRSFHWKKSE